MTIVKNCSRVKCVYNDYAEDPVYGRCTKDEIIINKNGECAYKDQVAVNK
jgi:hypothetical protein